MRPFLRCTLAAFTALLAMLALASTASAAINHEPLLRFGSNGSGAGQLGATWGLATDPATAHLATADSENHRISEFTPWGEFSSAFGWDVAPGPVNEQQEVRLRASAGTFKLSFGAATTPELPFGAPGSVSEEEPGGPESLEAALDALPTIGGLTPTPGSVTVTERKGAPDGSVPYVYVIAFHGALAAEDVPLLEVTNGATPPSGGTPTTVLEARTRADGGPATAGFEHCTAESGCQAGSGGAAAGQFKNILAAATDPAGDLYVREGENNRIQKLSPDGHFLWTIGGEVDKTRSEELGSTEAERNLCTAASGDVCQAGASGPGKGQFTSGIPSAFGLAFAAGRLYAPDGPRIQIFDEAGHYLEDLPDPGNVRAGKTVFKITADPARNRLYIDFQNEDNVAVLDATSGAELGQRKEHYDERITRPSGLALDPAGDLFVTAADNLTGGDFHRRTAHVAEFSPSGAQLLPDEGEEAACAVLEAQGTECDVLFGAPEAGEKLTGIGTGPDADLYIASSGELASSGEHRSLIRAFGPPPLAFEAPPPAPPSIDAQYAASVSDTEATLRAQINPHFFSGALGTTTYYLQYATAACIAAEGWGAPCVKAKPAAPGAVLKSAPIDAGVTSTPVVLEGLSPRTEYRYRFTAEGSGAPGVAIVGVEGEEGVEGKDAAFTTFPGPAEEAPQSCPANEAFHSGPSASLPDCRAYELVSPVDKEGGEVKVLPNSSTGTPAALIQASPDGNRVVYGSYSAFAGAESGAYTSQYLASRTEGAQWQSRAISPPATKSFYGAAGSLGTEFKYLSEDLCSAWLTSFADPPLTPDAVPGYTNIYRRQLCPAPGSYEVLSATAPSPAVSSAHYRLELQGLADGGAEAVYAATAKLTPDAPSLGGGLRPSSPLRLPRRGRRPPLPLHPPRRGAGRRSLRRRRHDPHLPRQQPRSPARQRPLGRRLPPLLLDRTATERDRQALPARRPLRRSPRVLGRRSALQLRPRRQARPVLGRLPERRHRDLLQRRQALRI